MVEKALRESEEKHKTLVERSLTGIFIHQEGKNVFVNDRFAENHSYTFEELLGKEYRALLHPDERDALAQIASARPRGEDVSQRYEVWRLARNGKTVWCEMMATHIEYRERPAIMGNLVDISQRKRAEEALRRSQQELRRLSSQLINVQEDERKRISWELNDSIGQVLASVKIGLGNAISKIRQGMASASVESLEALVSVVQQAITEVLRIYTQPLFCYILSSKKQVLIDRATGGG